MVQQRRTLALISLHLVVVIPSGRAETGGRTPNGVEGDPAVLELTRKPQVPQLLKRVRNHKRVESFHDFHDKSLWAFAFA